MTPEIFFCIKVETTISILGLAISLLTLILGFFAYRRFLFNQAKQKQLEIVCELIKGMQSNFNYYMFFENRDKFMKGNWGTAFDMLESKEFNECEKLFFWQQEWGKQDIIDWKFFYNFYSIAYCLKQ